MAETTRQFDVGAQRVGSLYARALLGAANAANQTDAVLGELDALVDDLLTRWPDLQQVFASVMVSHDDKLAMLDRLFAGKLSPMTLNFLKVLAGHGRLGNLREIRAAAHELHNEQQGRVRVEVTTAVPLTGDATARITESLRSLLKREPQLVSGVDPAMIGGLMLRVGDTVYDASVSTQLAKLREQVRRRSIQQIETAREKFLGA
ncbi:MAG: ATP synthase F1 subunit delta [Planctomycetes bacterium]|nr:ATP synthase F1 subunit delta [Planctomycetota bacterium]